MTSLLRSLSVAAALGVVLPVAAAAQVEDVQRCVWSCLYGPGGGDPASSAYHACVAATCIEDAPATAPATRGGDPTRVWQAGSAASGWRYAGIDLPGRAGRAGVYFFCRRNAASYIAMVGLDQPERVSFLVDGRDYPLRFRMVGGQVRASIPNGSPLIAALQSGSELVIRGQSTDLNETLSLRGSKQAFATTISGC